MTSVQSGNWSAADTWGGSVPDHGADVTIAAGHSVTVDVATAALTRFVHHGDLVFTGWTNAVTAVEVTINGGITHPPQSATATNALGQWIPDNRVLFVCTNLTITSTGEINVNEKGYLGGIGAIGGYNPPGYGPGASLGHTYGSGGAGYGGGGGRGTAGAITTLGSAGGNAYGEAAAPIEPGSGSGGAQSNLVLSGRSGGGAVRIEAGGSVLIDGSVLASGQGNIQYQGAGSGGGVFITCKTFKGSGAITAAGGNDTRAAANFRIGGAGGGGRIAVVYEPAAQAGVAPQPTVTFNAGGGYRTVASVKYVVLSRRSQGRPGSIYLSDDQFLDLARIRGGELRVPGFSALTLNTLTVSNNLLAFPDGFELTVEQDLALILHGGLEMTNGTLAVGGDVVMESNQLGAALIARGGSNQTVHLASNVYVTGGWIEVHAADMTAPQWTVPGDVHLDTGHVYWLDKPFAGSEWIVNGNLTATNASQIHLYAERSSDPIQAPAIRVGVAGELSLASNCWVYPYSHPTNGGSVFFRVGALAVSEQGGFNANAKGFWGGQRATTNNPPGYGPGRGTGSGSRASGGGYGGRGGHGVASEGGAASPVGGVAYGMTNAPVEPGSGAGGTYTSGTGGSGGGLIHILSAGPVLLDGSLLANGGVGTSYAGSGSGGGIYVAGTHLAGGGVVQAHGGSRSAGQGTAGSGGGGGGRIALRYGVPYTMSDAVSVETAAPAGFTGVVLALGGTGRYDPDNRGADGTVRFIRAIHPPGSVLMLR